MLSDREIGLLKLTRAYVAGERPAWVNGDCGEFMAKYKDDILNLLSRLCDRYDGNSD